MTLPNFLVIGAVKAGTTALYRYLIQHPDIFMPPDIKEPRFFCYDPNFPIPNLKIPVNNLEAYQALFDGAGERRAIGEASPHYLAVPHAAEAIRKLLPQVKLIASLRNPVIRSHSEYLMASRNAGQGVSTSFADVLSKNPKLVEHSRYDLQLERYFERFPRDQIKIIIFENLISDPAATMQSLFDFLGVDRSFVPDVSKNPNPGGVPRNRFLYLLLRNLTLNERLTPLRKKAPAFMQAGMRSLKRNINMKPVKLTREEINIALPLFRECIEKTERLIGQDLSLWLEP